MMELRALEAEFRAKMHKAMGFDGADDNVVVSSPTGLPTGSSSRTIIVWAKFDKDARNQMVWWGLGTTNKGCGFRTLATSELGYRGFRFYFWGNDLWVEYDYLTGTFLQCVAVYNENENIQQIYINGELIGERTPKIPDTEYSDLYIGYRAGLDIMDGSIALVYIYDIALSKSEIKHLYYNPFDPPNIEHLVLWLAPGSIDTANGKWWDLSGRNNHGTIYGCTEVLLTEPEVVVV